MNCLRKLDEYLVSTFYTAGALVANGVSEAYFANSNIVNRQEPVDIVLTCLFAATVSIVFSFIRKRRFRILNVLASTILWVVRSVMGIFLFGLSDIRDTQTLIYWIICLIGLVSSIIALFGQYIRHRSHHLEKTAVIEPVKIRFV
jgi:Na+/citrate or Na+/malate symporter